MNTKFSFSSRKAPSPCLGYGRLHPRLLLVLLMLLVAGALLSACGDNPSASAAKSSPSGNTNNNNSPANATTGALTNTPESVAEQLATALKSGATQSLGTGAGGGGVGIVPTGQGLGGNAAAGGFPQAASFVVQGKGTSYGRIYATELYGPLVDYSPFVRLTVEGVDSEKVVVLESEFHYALTNGMARLGMLKNSFDGKWIIATTRLDFDPPGVISRSGNNNDGLDKFTPKSFLEAASLETRNRLDKGLEQVYGAEVSIINIAATADMWTVGRTKPFALSTRPSPDGKSAQWLVHFDGRDRSQNTRIGTIRLLDGQPWGLFSDVSNGSPYAGDHHFQLNSITSDSAAACATSTNKAFECPRLSYGLAFRGFSWGVFLG